MNAKELMLGDWVQGYLPVYLKIAAILSEERVAVYCKDTYIELTVDDIRPVPLTVELLKKNGFGYIEKDEHLQHLYPGESQFCEDMNFHIGTDNSGKFWLNYRHCDIVSIYNVHELQHAFRVCGIDKEIGL